jgi:hypothetical protein
MFAMLDKTLALLTDVPPGTYLPDDVVCYDPAELDELGRVLDRLLYGPSSIRRLLQQKYGVTLTRADMYSEIPTIAEIERSFATPSLLDLGSVFPDNTVMVAELERLMTVSHEFDPPQESSRTGEYAWKNPQFSFSDAMAYYAMVRTRRPRTIVEIGGGWHTRVAQMACARNGFGRIVTIEPAPGAFLEALVGIEILHRRVQSVETDFFNELLHDGDMLFFDSSHTVKHDGDCLHIFLRVLPGLDAAVSVQAHDIYLPETLAIEYLRDRQVFWNEQYLLSAYLTGNPRTRPVFGSRYHVRHNAELLDQFMHGRFRAGGGSFWFEQERRV